MRKNVFVFLSCFIAFHCFSQSNFKYEAGASLGYDILQPKNIKSEYEYFNSTFGAGGSVNIGINNRLYYKKLFVRLQASFGMGFQQQNFVFSNQVDNIIDHTVQRQFPQWLFDYSFGRDFKLNDLNFLELEFGISTIGNFYLSSTSKEYTGSFSSSYIAAGDHSSGMSVQEYEYTMKYNWPAFSSPFVKCGVSLPFYRNRVVFGVAVRFNRHPYTNFITITSNNYSAIAHSKARSHSIGFYLNYQFINSQKKDKTK
jgi:hypothetical protein